MLTLNAKNTPCVNYSNVCDAAPGAVTHEQLRAMLALDDEEVQSLDAITGLLQRHRAVASPALVEQGTRKREHSRHDPDLVSSRRGKRRHVTCVSCVESICVPCPSLAWSDYPREE